MNDKTNNPDYSVVVSCPDFEGFIDSDILERFQGTSVCYGDIINAQMIKTNRELIEALRCVKTA